jgi:hypothetical protein
MVRSLIREEKSESIMSDGHFYFIGENGEDRITFFDNPFGDKLKQMWEQLNKPIGECVNGKKKFRLKRN